MFDGIINWIVEQVSSIGYTGIILLMFLESSFFPFPSEVVIPPAGYLAAKGQMDLALVIISGIVGSLLGGLFNYAIALFLGRSFLNRYGKYLLIKEEKLKKLEDFFEKHGAISTFTGRLIPGIRQYISLPAGLARMNILIFSLFTAAGAGLWVIILALIGYFIGSNEYAVKKYINYATVLCLIFTAFVVTSYYIINKNKRLKNAKRIS